MYVELENTPYSGLIQHHLRIGDTFFFVPPTSIQIGHTMKNNKAYILRARSPMVEETGFVERKITINLFFANLDAINNEFRPILAQTRKCPFLPIENVYLNEVHNIHAVAINGITTSNVEGFPHCLQVQIECMPFNVEGVLNDPLGRRYDEMINWDMFRWYYKRSLDKDYKYSYVTHYEMLYEDLHDEFTFYVADENSLEAIREWRKEKRLLLYGREAEKARRTRDFLKGFVSDSKEYQEFMEKYKEHAANAILYEQVDYLPYDLPGLILTNFSFGLNNNIVSVPMQMQEDPMHQFMGAQDIQVTLEFQTTDMEVIAHMNAMMLKNQWLLREYHAEMPYGLMKFDHQMTRLLGSQHISIEDVQFVASNEHTGIYTVQVIGSLYKKNDRKLTEMQWINAPDSPFNKSDGNGGNVFDWDINRYADQSLIGRMIPDIKRDAPWYQGGANSYTLDIEKAEGTIFDPIADIAEWGWNMNPANRNWFGLADTPAGRKSQEMWDKIFKGYSDLDNYDRKRLTEYEYYIKQSMGSYELYPDLELPTWHEFEAEFGIKPPDDYAKFVDPDFFIDYADNALMVADVARYLMDEANTYSKEASADSNNTITVFEDPFGGTVNYDVGAQDFDELKGYDDDFAEIENKKKELDKQAKDYAAEQKKARSDKSSNIVVKDEYKVNMDIQDAEALIRQSADAGGKLSQAYAVAFAKVDNKDLQQYFNDGANAGLGGKNASGKHLVVGFKNTDNSKKKTSLTVIGSTEDTRADAGKATHIGIMKIPTGNNHNTSAAAIYIPGENIKQGVDSLGKAVDAVMAKANAGTHGTKTEVLQYVRDYFGSTFNYAIQTDGQTKFFLATLWQMGQTVAVTQLLERKKPEKVDANIAKFAFEVHKQMIDLDKSKWTAADLKAKTADIKIPDITAETEEKEATKEEKKGEGSTIQELNIQNTAFFDMLQYDRRGRLIRCFPTMLGMFIDEGRYIKSVKVADNFFNYQAFQDITFINNRKDASSTCYIELNNVNQNLTDASKTADVAESSIWQFLQSFAGAGELAFIEQRARDNETFDTMKSVSLTTGTRFHLRMGYGADARQLPTIMNGTITSIQNDGPIMSLIIQDDGIELAGKIKAKPNDSTDQGWFSNKDEPTEIIDYLLADDGGFWHDMKRRFSSTAYREHSLGVRHFGLHDDDYSLRRAKSSAVGVVSGMGAGALGGAALGAWFFGVGAIPGAVIGTIAGGITGGLAAWNPMNRKITELNMNIHPHNGMNSDDYTDRGMFDKMKELFGMGESDESNVNIGLYDKSIWDVLNICAAIDNDHVVAVHPFDFRSTIFSGRPNYPIKTGYQFDPEKAANFKNDPKDNAEYITVETKQFRQLRIYDSYTDISSNTMTSSEKNIYNVATPIYMNEGEIVSAPPIYVDKNIHTDRQKHVNIDTAINAKGFWGVDSIPLIGDWLNKPAEFVYDEGVAIRIAAAGLRDFMKDMYDGYITVMGDPSTKPYDMAWINDDYLKIQGPVEIKEVVHMMNYDVGFVTMIKPDLVVINRDIKQIINAASHLVGAVSFVAMGFGLRKLAARMLKLNGKSTLAHVMWAMAKSGFNVNKRMLVGSFNMGNTLFDKVTGKKISPSERKARYEARQNKYDADTLLKTFRSDEGLVKKYWNVGSDKIKDFTSRLTSKSLKLTTLSSKLKVGAGKLKGIGKTLKTAKAASLLARFNPIGLLLTVAEGLFYYLGGSVLREMLVRDTYYENACYVLPVRRNNYAWTSGLNGAGASIIGKPSRKTLKQRILSWGPVDVVSKFLFGVSTADVVDPIAGWEGIDDVIFGDDESMSKHADVEVQSMFNQARQYRDHVLPIVKNYVVEEHQRGGKITQEKMDEWVADASASFVLTIATPLAVNMAQSVDYDLGMYKERAMRVLNTLESRINFPILKKSKTILDIAIEKGSDLLENLKDTASNLFKKLFDFIKGLVGGSSESNNCSAEGVTLDGKFNVSNKNFDYLNPLIEKECEKQGASQYKELIKAITMQESGGNYKKTPDVMQSSESKGFQMNTITAVEASIKAGVEHWLKCVKVADGDLTVALQCYNFGTGFAKYAKERGGYSKETAAAFSNMWAKKMNWRRYGDKDYVPHVLRYYTGTLGTVNCESSGGSGEIGFAATCAVLKKGGSYKQNVEANRASSTASLVRATNSNTEKNVRISDAFGATYMRKGALDILNKVAKEWATIMPGDVIQVNSCYRRGDTYYHGTGWAIDIQTQHSKWKGGRLVGPSKAHSERNEKLIRLFIKHGYRSVYFADDSFVPKLEKEFAAQNGNRDGYGGWYVKTEKTEHYHHIHVAYPVCK